VDVFESVAALESYLEPWYVDEPHFIFDSEGMQLEITRSGTGVRLVPREPKVFNTEIARRYFAALLKSIAVAKGWDRVGVAEDFVETAPLSQLATECKRFATR